MLATQYGGVENRHFHPEAFCALEYLNNGSLALQADLKRLFLDLHNYILSTCALWDLNGHIHVNQGLLPLVGESWKQSIS